MPTLVETVPTTYEQATEAFSATVPASDQRIDVSVLPEMPSSHPEVNAAAISVSGLIKNCPHYAEMYKEDPERAKTEATQTAQKAQEVSALRDQGMSAKEIKAKMLADNLARAKEKAKVVGKEEDAKVEQEPEAQVKVAQETKLAVENNEVVQAVQPRKRDKKPLVVAAEKVTAIQQQTEPATKTHQESVAKTQVVTVRDEQQVEPQRADTFIHHQQLIVIQEQPLVDNTENEQVPDLPPNRTLAQELVSEVSAAVYEHKLTPKTDVNIDVFQQFSDVFDSEAATISQEATFDFEELTKDDELMINTLILPLTEDTETDDIEVTAEQNTETDEQLTLQFEPEVIDTYKELLVLIEDRISEPKEFNESAVELEDKTDVLVAERVLPEDTTQDFETFFALQPEAEEVITLETIIEHSDEQPLEQTLAQLAQHLSDTLVENQDKSEASADTLPGLSDEYVELDAILQEIAETLPTCYSLNEETQEKCIQITPEVAGKLLTLLRTLGYQNPREVLVSFVVKYGLTFLLQALEYICQLSKDDNRQEFSLTSATPAACDDDDARLRFGKALFGFIAKLTLEPNI